MQELKQPHTATQTTATRHRDIVVIGAGSGGLTAACRLLTALPPTLEVAILLALDVGSQPALSVLQILRGYSRFPVVYASAGADIRQGTVLLSPARQNMVVARTGCIGLEHERAFSASVPSVNRLFGSAAMVYGRRVIGIVLSGASHDGTAGLVHVEAEGGVGIVQDPQEAFDDSMPSNALQSDDLDYCCTLEQMGPLVVRLAAGETPARRATKARF